MAKDRASVDEARETQGDMVTRLMQSSMEHKARLTALEAKQAAFMEAVLKFVKTNNDVRRGSTEWMIAYHELRLVVHPEGEAGVKAVEERPQ